MSGSQVFHEAFVTLTTSDAYALGCLVLAHSLKRVQTTRQLVVMVTSGVSQTMRQRLNDVFDVVTVVDALDSRDMTNLKLLDRPDLGVTFTKLHCWRLTQFTKCVFIDADAMVLQNIDDLFEREELSAAPDPGWPDCFNSGVFVFCPSEATYTALLDFAVSVGSFDGGDQGLLNLFFSDWATKDIKRHLPFLYNVVSQAFYSYLPAFKQFGKDAKVVHFIGPVKPWQNVYNTATGHVIPQQGTGHNGDFLQMWWNIFMECVFKNLDSTMTFLLRFIHEEPAPKPVPAREHHGWHPPYQQYFSPQMAPPPVEHFSPATPEYHMRMPYVPPSLPQTFYEPPSHEHHGCLTFGATDACSHVNHEPVSEYVPPPEAREYHFFESHYTETPLTQVDLFTPPPESYVAKEFFDPVPPSVEPTCFSEPPSGTEDSGVMDYTSGSDGEHENGDGHCTTGVSDSIKPSIYPTDADVPSEGTVVPTAPPVGQEECELKPDAEKCAEDENGSCISSVHSEDEHSDSQTDGSESDVSTEDLTTEEESDFGTDEDDILFKTGLVQELATIKLESRESGVAPPELTDRERRDLWERGQMDYLGEDRFDKILERITATINGGAEKPAVAAETTSSRRTAPAASSAGSKPKAPKK